jgi:hypothetical protein
MLPNATGVLIQGYNDPMTSDSNIQLKNPTRVFFDANNFFSQMDSRDWTW